MRNDLRGNGPAATNEMKPIKMVETKEEVVEEASNEVGK